MTLRVTRRLGTRRLGAVVGAVALAGSLASCASVAGISDPPTATVGGAVSSSRAQAIAAQVIDTALRLLAIVEVARADDGAAVSASEMAARREVLREIETAARRAVEAACSYVDAER